MTSAPGVVWPDGRRHPERPRLREGLTNGSMPYHPIVSLGTRRRLERTGTPPQWWPVCAPLLEEVWNGAIGSAPTREELADRLVAAGLETGRALAGRGTADAPHGRIPATVARETIAAAYDARALSCAQSMDAAQRLALADLLTYTREGHTATVLTADDLAVNLARDGTDAASDLTSSTEQLRYWGQVAPDLVVDVHAGGTVSTRWFEREQLVAYSLVGLVPDCHELHVIGPPDHPRLVEVQRFVHDPQTTGIRLVPQPDGHSAALWRALVRLQSRLARVSDADSARGETIALALNEGDVVSHGKEPEMCVVACDAEPWTGPVRMLPYVCALPHAAADGAAQQLWHHDAAGAVAEMKQHLLSDDPRSPDVWEAARTVTPTELMAALGTPGPIATAAVVALREVVEH